jgi:hypothetical protein
MSAAIRRSRRLAAKPAVNYQEEDEMIAVASPVRKSSRLAAKPAVNYSELDEDEVAAPAVTISIRIADKPVDEEKTRHIAHIKGLLLKIDNIKGDKPARAAGAVEIMHYVLTCKAFCDAHPRFREAVAAKCYELKKYEGEEFPEVASACDAVLHMFGKPLEVPAALPVVLSPGSCGDCSGCKKEEEKLRANLEKRHAKKKEEAVPVSVDIVFLRQHLRRIQGEMEDAETEGYFHSLVDDYLIYVRKPEVLAALKASPSDRMMARAIIRQYENDLCCHHVTSMEEFLKLCPV